MIHMKKIFALIILSSLACSCEYENISAEEVTEAAVNQSVVGSWLLVETGYSIGGPIITVPVPADPPKTITFNADLTLSSVNAGFDRYKHYRVLEDTAIDRQVIAFFEENPETGPLELSGLKPTYNIFRDGNYLNLNYRWCIEGCHMKFKRISPAQPE